METAELLKEIKSELRLAMNGKASQSMREKGLNYRVNFGVELPRLKEMASRLPHEESLAQALWREEIRECKILATLVQPADSFETNMATLWVEQMPNTEIADYAAKNLLCHMHNALSVAFEWMARDEGLFAYCGCRMITHLLMQGTALNERNEEELIDQAACLLTGSEPASPLRRAAYIMLQKYALQAPAQAAKLMKLLPRLTPATDEELHGMYHELEAAKKG